MISLYNSKIQGKTPEINLLVGFIDKILLLFITISLSASVTILKFERNHYFGEFTHPAELAALSYISTNVEDVSVDIISWRTSIWAAYYNYKPSYEMNRLWYQELENNETEIILLQKKLIEKLQYIVRGMRDPITYGGEESSEYILRSFDEMITNGTYNVIFSNSYYTIYKKMSK